VTHAPSSIVRHHAQISYAVASATARSRPPIVFLHGLASNRTRWTEFIRETTLKAQHDLIAVDLRGHGESITRRKFSLEDWSADIAAILDQEKASQAIVVGHSMGAQAALYFGAARPDKLAGLVLIDPVFREAILPEKRSFVRNGPLYSLAASTMRALNAVGIHRGALPPLDLHALDLKAREALASPEPDAVEKFVAQYSSAKADLKHIPHANYLQDMVEMFRALPSLSAITCPALALRSTVAGYQDDAVVERRLREMPRVAIEAINCHHWPLTERPVEVRTLVERWIEREIEQ
jgi:esterase